MTIKIDYTATLLSPNRYVGRRAKIRLIVIHTMESGETATTAEGVARYFQKPSTKASAHVNVDTDGLVRCVPDSDTAWACPGCNTDGLQLELAGRAGQGKLGWMDPASQKILKHAAKQVAQWSQKHGIPVKHLTNAELAAGAKGIIGHVQGSQVYKRSTHTDPGKDFPWSQFLGMVRKYLAADVPAPAPKPEATHLKVAHASMQFSDTKAQVEADFAKIFSRGYAWITGTEAGEDPVKSALRAAATKAGYIVQSYKSNWITVKKSLYVPGSYSTGHETVMDNDLVVGPGHDPNIIWATFKVEELGWISVLSSHYATKGDPFRDPHPNLEVNKKIAAAVGRRIKLLGEGANLAFYGGDQNILDRNSDTFFGQPLTSSWDELRKYESTGHGGIDVIASYDGDVRVKALSVAAFNDKELFLNSDHYLVETVFSVEHLKGK